eukprot:6203845-Pleurochrysis_carterae.AAC.1
MERRARSCQLYSPGRFSFKKSGTKSAILSAVLSRPVLIQTEWSGERMCECACQAGRRCVCNKKWAR